MKNFYFSINRYKKNSTKFIEPVEINKEKNNLSTPPKLYPRSQYDAQTQRENPICPFCTKNIYEPYLVWKGNYLYIKHNKHPFQGKKEHFLVIPYRHIPLTSEMTIEEFQELREVEIWMKNFYKNTNYFSFIREQSPLKSVHHLHYHFCSGNLSGEDMEKLFKMILYKNVGKSLTFSLNQYPSQVHNFGTTGNR